jgi:hypothetical protein
MHGSAFKPKYIVDGDMSAVINGPWLGIRGIDNLGFQCKWTAPAARVVAHHAGDAVVASTKTWTFANGAFTAADVGGTFTMGGTSGTTNDGAFVIASVTNATTVVSVGSPGGNETFGSGVTMSMQQLSPTGVITVETSADGELGRTNLPDGRLGSAAITPVTNGSQPAGSASKMKLRCNQVDDPWARLVYTPTTGGGVLQAAFSGKGI